MKVNTAISRKSDRYDTIERFSHEFKHPVFHPMKLVDEMIEKSQLVREAKILVLYNIEFAVSILEDYEDIYPQDIYLLHDDDDTVTAICSKLGVNPITMKELQLTVEDDMKFDLVIGNPPFSDTGNKKQGRGRTKLLYPEFYQWSINHADTVAMIMPRSNTNLMLEKHNNLVRKADDVVDIEHGTFGAVNMPMWTVYSGTGKKRKTNIQWSEKLEQKNEIFFKGKLNIGMKKHMLQREQQRMGDTTIFWKVVKDEVVTRYHPRTEMKETWMLPKNGYCVLMPQAIQTHGWTNTAIVKMNGNQVAGIGMSIAHFKTKREAKEFVEYMKTEEFIEQAVKVRTRQGGLTMGALRSIEINR